MEITEDPEDPEEDSLSERPQVGLMDDHENPDSRKNDDQMNFPSHEASEDIPSDHDLIEAILAHSPSPSPSPRMRKRKNSQESSGERKKMRMDPTTSLQRLDLDKFQNSTQVFDCDDSLNQTE